jgi:hypothetical protein
MDLPVLFSGEIVRLRGLHFRCNLRVFSRILSLVLSAERENDGSKVAIFSDWWNLWGKVWDGNQIKFSAKRDGKID